MTMKRIRAPFRSVTMSAVVALILSACHHPAPERGAAPELVAARASAGPVEEAPRPELPVSEVSPEPESVAQPEPSIAAPEKKGMDAAKDDGYRLEASATGSSNVAPAPRSAAPSRRAAGAPAGSLGALGGGVMAQKSRTAPMMPATPAQDLDQEAYAASADTGFSRVVDSPLSTFSIDVDTASYANVRRFLAQGQLPPAGAVRIEELVNYFPYAYAEPQGDAPFSVTTEVSEAPWNPKHRLLHVGLQAKRIETSQLPPRNLVFLLDVSGSMESPNKLPLLKRSLETLTETLSEKDKVAIVVYAGASGVVLPATSGDRKAQILAALDRLEAGGSTNGGAGIELAYSIASELARPGASTRVVLATDGDFNVGTTSEDALVRLIEQKRQSGVYLSVLGFGMGNYKDSTLEQLADKGNGNYAYVDTIAEARKVLVAEGGATLVTLAQDVKLQLEFNPALVGSYRLIGYENRRLEARDFNDDQKDAGELGAGHGVTALYELIPPALVSGAPAVDATKYQSAPQLVPGHAGELCTIKLRYKKPGASESQRVEQVVRDGQLPLAATSPAFRFSAAVAAFGMTLRNSSERGSSSYDLARELARGAIGRDLDGYQREFVGMIDTAASISHGSAARGPLAMP
ncbi:MAG TPA: von Willebrand factor type A domain-containing protein [Polyangiaceae bacterium]|nr:von Willebrand factor type A domain-containing protein [Polyangiaceae bacterium]